MPRVARWAQRKQRGGYSVAPLEVSPFGLPATVTVDHTDAGDLLVINAGNGNDTIYGGGGHNSINVGSGNDTIYGGPLGDAINVGGRNTGTDNIYLGAGGGNSVNTGSGTTIVFAQNGHVDTIACHGTTTVYADHVDHTTNCTHVIFTSPSADHVKKEKATKRLDKNAARLHARRS